MDSPRTAQLLSRTPIYNGRVFRVEIDRVTLPTGHTVDMELIRHAGSVVLLPIPEPGKIILIRQYRYTVGRDIWELPAGGVKPGEDLAAAAARECEEEINLAPHKVTLVGSYYPTPGICDELMNFFLCEDLRAPAPDSTAKKDEDEDIHPRVFTMADARALVASGDIIDLKTLAGLTLVR
jgi:ADP-ribose pyrophosphatase